MRLIDANALQQHFIDMQNYEKCAANFPDHRGEPSTNWYCVEDALENAPTVKAIPIEWLEHKRDKEMIDLMMNIYGLGDSDLCHAICVVLEAWHEQEG